jgi:hypothetical protein
MTALKGKKRQTEPNRARELEFFPAGHKSVRAAAGVEALARLRAADRNGELTHWRRRGDLPSWHEPQFQQAA